MIDRVEKMKRLKITEGERIEGLEKTNSQIYYLFIYYLLLITYYTKHV